MIKRDKPGCGSRAAHGVVMRRLVRHDLLAAAKKPDWMQVLCNGGPPCFHVEDGRFCFRAERWQGHDEMHKYVSLESLLRSVVPNT